MATATVTYTADAVAIDYRRNNTSMITYQKTIGTTAVQVLSTTELAGDDNRTPLGLSITPLTANSGVTYLGLSGVTSSTGHQIPKSSPFLVDTSVVRELYAVGTNASDAISVLVKFK